MNRFFFLFRSSFEILASWTLDRDKKIDDRHKGFFFFCFFFFPKRRQYDVAAHFSLTARRERNERVKCTLETRTPNFWCSRRVFSDSRARGHLNLLARFSCVEITDLSQATNLYAKFYTENDLSSSSNWSFLRSPAIFLFNWTTVINHCLFCRFWTLESSAQMPWLAPSRWVTYRFMAMNCLVSFLC